MATTRAKPIKIAVIAAWLVLAAIAGPLSLKLGSVQHNETLAGLPSGSEAKEAADRAEAAFSQGEGLVAVAVYARRGGLTDADRRKVDGDRSAFTRYARSGVIAQPVPSSDGEAMLLSFALAGDDDEQSAATGHVRDVLEAGRPDGLRTALTGTAGADSDTADAFGGMDVTLLLATAATVALILLLTYRSPILWIVPLFVVGVANQAAGAAVYLLARHAGLTVDFQSQSILTVLVFGVGIDYALLLIARYREELRRHADRHDAMRVALRRSFPAVCASAATVTLALLCLLAARMPATAGVGPVAAIGIVATLAAMMTLLPAVLVLAGRWLFWPFVPRYSAEAAELDAAADHGIWARVAELVGRRPRLVWIGSALALAALATGIGSISIGLPNDEVYTKTVGSITGQHIIADHFPAGAVSPAEIYATAGTAGQVADAARGVTGIAEVGEPERSPDGRWVRVPAVLADAPSSDAARTTIDRLRESVRAVPGSRGLVGGVTAEQLDSDRAVARDNRLVMPLVLIVVFGVLIVLLRALVAPLLLLATVVASFAAALGGAGLVLNAMGHPKLWSGLPLQAFLFLVALGVDYTIFLMTRAREEVAVLGHRGGIQRALTVTGGVITSAGLVLAATFSALGVLPLVPSVQVGIVVAVGVLIDTLVVRSLLVPALAVDLGARTWWPHPLWRRRPATCQPPR